MASGHCVGRAGRFTLTLSPRGAVAEDCGLKTFLFMGLMVAALAAVAPVAVAQAEFELGDPVLLMAAEEGMENLVERRLRNGAAVDSRDALGRTPLIQAARNNHERLVKLLLRQGADAELADGTGHTAVSWAILRGHVMVAHSLLSALRGTPAYDGQVFMALEAARQRGDEKTAAALREIYADAESPPPEEFGEDAEAPVYRPPGSEADEEVDSRSAPWPRPAWPAPTRPPRASEQWD